MTRLLVSDTIHPMSSRRAALILLALMAICLAGEFIFDADHGADFASEIGSWGGSAARPHFSDPVLIARCEIVHRLRLHALKPGELHRIAEAGTEIPAAPWDAPTGRSPPAGC